MRHVTVQTMSFPSSTDAWPMRFSAPMRSRFDPISVVANCVLEQMPPIQSQFPRSDNHFPYSEMIMMPWGSIGTYLGRRVEARALDRRDVERLLADELEA